jgi:preprotein translocase subunit SecE
VGLFQRGEGEGVKARPAAESESRNPVAWVTTRVSGFRTFVGEVWAELKKTTWPSRREVYGTTVVVIVAVIITAVFLYVVDLALAKAMESLFGVFGR